MTVKQQQENKIASARKYAQENPTIGRINLAKKFTIEENEARRIVDALRSGKSAEERTSQTPRVRAKLLSEFRRDHDIPQKIRDRLEGMRDGTYLTEEEMRQLCEVPVNNWRRNAELPEFADFKFKHDGVSYWAPTATIREMKKITGRA